MPTQFVAWSLILFSKCSQRIHSRDIFESLMHLIRAPMSAVLLRLTEMILNQQFPLILTKETTMYLQY